MFHLPPCHRTPRTPHWETIPAGVTPPPPAPPMPPPVFHDVWGDAR
jgi:hypothetical protein